MKRILVIVFFILIMFAPTLVEHFVYAGGHLDLLPWAKLFVHFVLPVLFTVLFIAPHIRAVAWDPIGPKPGWHMRRDLTISGLLGLLAVVCIAGSYFLLRDIVDVAGIAENLTARGISANVYPFIALWIVLVNPFMEEYFWRGFVFYRGYQLAKGKFMKRAVLYGSGVLFALHHTIIVEEWFSWWQFLLVTIFLSFAGVVFNLLYRRSGSILPSFIVHFLADATLAVIGFFVFGIVGG